MLLDSREAPFGGLYLPTKTQGIFTMRTQVNYTELAYMISDMVSDLKEAKSRDVENQNQEYIDRLTKAIATLERLKVYY